MKSKISSNAASSKQSSKLQSRKQSKHENKRLLPDQQIVHPPQGGAKASKGPKGHQKRSQSNPAIQNHFQQQKFFSRHQSKRPSVQQSPHLQVISLSACLFSPRHLRCKILQVKLQRQMIDISELTTLKSKSKLQSDKCQSLGLKQCSSKLVIRLIKYIMKQNFLYIIETFKDSQEISAMVHMQMKHSHSNAILSVNT